MGTLSFCRLTLRRGSRLLKRSKSPAPENNNGGHDGNGSRGNTESAPDPVDPPVPETAFELAVLHDPPGATVDIVAVHGISSDFSSWESTTDRGKSWLATLLPADFPTARIITFSHSPEPLPLQDAISQAADNLLRSVRGVRRKTGQARRPVIFVSHSLGGLVVQRALVVARDARDLASRDVYLATRGVMYFGVPGPCSGDDRLQGVLADISRMMTAARGKPPRAGGGHLDSFGDDAAALADGIRAFEGIGDRLHSVSASFCETVPTSTPSGRFIVDQDCVARAAEIVALRRSHADLMRFVDADDEGYVALRDWIAHILDPETFLHDPLAFRPDPRHLEGLADAYNQVSFLRTDFDVRPKLPPVTECHVRRPLLDTLRERFSALSRRGRIPAVALTGPPGVGKTFLARHFSDRVSQTSRRSVFWLDATSRETLRASYLEVGRAICDYYWDEYSQTLLGLHGGDQVGARAYLHNMLGVVDVNDLGNSLGHLNQVIVDASIKAVVDWLLYPENKWLLVLDNVGSGVDLLEFLPLALNGHILLISQTREVRNLPPGALTVEVTPWSETEAYELLLAGSGRPPHDAAQEQAARTVVRQLECRPSSVAHAASVIRRRDVSFLDFGADANASEPALSGLDEHPRRDQMKEVMAVASMLSDAPLPLDLLVSIENTVRTRLSGDSGVAWWRHSGAETRRTRVADSLKELGLLEQASSDPPLFLIPVPVRAYFRAAQPRQAWLASSACAATLERQAHPASTPSEVHASGRLLLPHVLACHDWIAHLADYEPSRPDPKRTDFSALGRLCAAQGLPSEAASWFELALRRGEGLGAAERGEAMFSLAMLRGGARRDGMLRGIPLCDGGARDAGLEARVRLALAEGRLPEGHGGPLLPDDDDDEEALSELNHLAQDARDPSTSIAALRALARAHAAAGAAESAAESRGALAARYRDLLGPAHPAALDEEEGRALALAATVRGPAAAAAALRTCMAIRGAAGGGRGPHPSVAAAQFRLAVLLDGEGGEAVGEADGWFCAALTGMEGMGGEYHPGYLDAKEELGVCFGGRTERGGGGVDCEEEMGIAGDILRDVISAREEVGMEAGGTRERLAEVVV